MMIEATDLGTVLDLKKKTTKNRPRTMGTQPEEAKIDATIAAHDDDLGAVGPVLGGTATPGRVGIGGPTIPAAGAAALVAPSSGTHGRGERFGIRPGYHRHEAALATEDDEDEQETATRFSETRRSGRVRRRSACVRTTTGKDACVGYNKTTYPWEGKSETANKNKAKHPPRQLLLSINSILRRPVRIEANRWFCVVQ